MNIEGYDRYRQLVEEGLDRYLPPENTKPASLHQAMRYSACGGGKRLRGVCCLMAAELFGVDPSAALPMACALEMVHAYSLIHDDLPCMDNDDLRRGKPTCHKVYGEAVALMAGNALLTWAILTVLTQTPPEIPKDRLLTALQELVAASGPEGMLGGQVLDLAAEGRRIPYEELKEIHRRKTGALILASVRTGAIFGGACAAELQDLTDYGTALGFAFQITDDLLDVTSSTQVLGKTVGSDLRNEKSTYPALLGLEEAERKAKEETEKAERSLERFGERAAAFRQLARYVLVRNK